MKRILLKPKIIFFFITIIFSLGLLATFLPQSAEPNIIAPYGPFADQIKKAGYPIKEVFPEQIPSYSDSASSLVLNASAAHPFVASRSGKFTPFYLSTIVIAVDPNQTNAAPSSWKELRLCKEKIAISSKNNCQILSSLAYGLGNSKGALQYLKELKKQDRLLYQSGANAETLFQSAPIAILTDTEAAQWILAGHSLEIFVPSEGTLSMPWGIYEKDPCVSLSPTQLMQAGLRLPDGTCNASLYADDYSSAHIINDLQRYGETAERFFTQFRRDVLGTRRFTTANGTEHLFSYLCFSFCLCIWAFFIYLRTTDSHFQSILLAQVSILLFWMMLRYLKLLFYGENFILWYLYYLPQIFSPLLFVFACHSTLGKKEQKQMRWRNILFFSISAGLFLLVLTNNWHQLVFRFAEHNIIHWSSEYTYSVGYFLIVGWIGFLIIYSFFFLFRYVCQPRYFYKLFAPISVLFLLLLYCILYTLRVQIVWESEISFTLSLFILLSWELCLDARIFHVNTHYGDIFRNTKVPIWLLRNDLKIETQSLVADQLPSNIKKFIMEGKMHFSNSDAASFDIMKIHGGYVVWKTDLQHILILQANLRRKAKEMEEQNQILQKESALKKEVVILESRRKTIAKLESILSHQFAKIEVLSQTLSDPLDQKSKATLIQIKLLVGFCKRIGMLICSDDGKQNPMIAMQAFGLLLSETAIDCEIANITCNVYYPNQGHLPLKNAISLYLFFHQCIMHFLKHPGTTIFCRLLASKKKFSLVLILDGPKDVISAFLAQAKKDCSSDIFLQVFMENENCILRPEIGGYES